MKRTLLQSFGNALSGFFYLLKHERNFRIQTLVGLIAIAAGIYFRLSEVEWLFVLSAIFRVIGHESINTSVEDLADVCEKKKDLDIKHIKDVSATYVLLSAIYSVVVGAIVFLPKIIALF